MDYATEVDVSVDEDCGNVDRCNGHYTGNVVGAMTHAATYYSWQCSECDYVNEREGYGWDDLREG
jgi:hypothetical protein